MKFPWSVWALILYGDVYYTMLVQHRCDLSSYYAVFLSLGKASAARTEGCQKVQRFYLNGPF